MLRNLLAAVVLVLATAGAAQPASRDDTLARGVAVAEQVLAAERAFETLAARDGQWTAFRATVADGAVLFVPRRVDASTWLAGRADPPQSPRWQPHGVFVSCDGQAATTYGYSQSSTGNFNRFRTLWQRQADGSWKWLLIAEWPVAADQPAPSEPEILIARCDRMPPAPSPGTGALGRRGSSPDGSLRWYEDVDATGRGTLSLHGWNGRFFQQISSDVMGSPAP